MPLTVSETVLGSLIVVFVSGVAGRFLGGKGRVSENECEERRDACSSKMCIILEQIKNEQGEMKKDIKDLLKRPSDRSINKQT